MAVQKRPAPLPDLTAAFTAAGLVDVAYTIEASPLGPLLLAATPRGLLRVGYPDVDRDQPPGRDRQHEQALAEIAARISPRVIAAPARLDPVRRQLEEFFAGRRRRFDLTLDRRLIRPGFFAEVLVATAAIPYGQTTSYTGVATAAGSPRAFRAAGTALGANPLPIVIPCHRVLPAGGGLGGYAGGAERKGRLLALEGSYSGA
jgi:methylated-DNA-[protein]-cysteine S-methyltransferase